MPSHYNVLALLLLVAFFTNSIICGGESLEPQYVLLRHGKKVAEPTLHEVLQMEKAESEATGRRVAEEGGVQPNTAASDTLLPSVVDYVEPLATTKNSAFLPGVDNEEPVAKISSLLPGVDSEKPATKSNNLLPSADFVKPARTKGSAFLSGVDNEDPRTKSNTLLPGADFVEPATKNNALLPGLDFIASGKDTSLLHGDDSRYIGKEEYEKSLFIDDTHSDTANRDRPKQYFSPTENIYEGEPKMSKFIRKNKIKLNTLAHRDENKDSFHEPNTLHRRVENGVGQNLEVLEKKQQKPLEHRRIGADKGFKREPHPNALFDEIEKIYDFNSGGSNAYQKSQNIDLLEPKFDNNNGIEGEQKSKTRHQGSEYDFDQNINPNANDMLEQKFQTDNGKIILDEEKKLNALPHAAENIFHAKEKPNTSFESAEVGPKGTKDSNLNFKSDMQQAREDYGPDERMKTNLLLHGVKNKVDNNKGGAHRLNHSTDEDDNENFSHPSNSFFHADEKELDPSQSKDKNRFDKLEKSSTLHPGVINKFDENQKVDTFHQNEENILDNLKAFKEKIRHHKEKEFAVEENHLDALNAKYGFARPRDAEVSSIKNEQRENAFDQQKDFDTRRNLNALPQSTDTELDKSQYPKYPHHFIDNYLGSGKKANSLSRQGGEVNLDKSEKLNDLHRIGESNFVLNVDPIDEFSEKQKLNPQHRRVDTMKQNPLHLRDYQNNKLYHQSKYDSSEKFNDGFSAFKAPYAARANLETTFENKPMFDLLQMVEKQHVKSDNPKPHSDHITKLLIDHVTAMETKNPLFEKQTVSHVSKKISKPVVKAADKRKDFPALMHGAEKAIKRGLPELPDLSTLLSKDAKTGIKYEFNDCEFEIVNDGCKILFIPKDETCKGKISLSKLLAFLTKEDVTKSDLTNLIPMQVFQVERFKIDKCDGDAEFETIATESFYVIKEEIKIYPEDHHTNNGKRNYTDLRMKIKKSHLILNFNSKEISKHFQFKRVGVDLQGDVEIAGETHSIIVTKTRHDEEMRFLIKLNSISVSQFANAFTWRKFSDNEIMKSLDIFLDVGISEPIVTGRTFTDGSYELTLKGRTQNMSGYGEMPANIVVKKEIGEPICIAVLIEIKRIKPVTLLSELTGKDLLNVPLLKDLSEKFLLEFSNADIMNITDASVKKMMQKHVNGHQNTVIISKGIKLKLFVPVKRIFQASSLVETNATTDYEKIPDLIPIQIHLQDGFLNFRFPIDAFMDLHDIVSALMPSSSENLFKQILKVSTVISITKFNINLVTKEVDVVAKGPKSVILGDDVIKLDNAEFKLRHKRKGSWEFQINAIKKIANEEMKVKVLRKGDVFQLAGEMKNLTTKAIDGHFGKADSKVFEEMEFLNFQVYDVKMQLQFGNTTSIQVTGVPALYNWDSTFEGYIFDSEGSDDKPKMAFGVVIKNIQLEEILDNFLETRIMHSSWMPKADAVLEISNLDADQVNFTAPDLRKITSLHNGAWLYTTIYVPSDCKSEVFCEMLQEKTRPDTVFDLKGELTSSGCELHSRYRGKISFGEEFQLEHVKLMVRVKNVRENTHGAHVWMEGVMRIKDPKIVFNGRLSVGRSGKVELKLSMRRKWRNPYSLPYIAFESLQMNVAVQSDAFFSKLELVGEMLLGRRKSQDVIRANAALGFNPLNKADNFFYAQIEPFTVKQLVDAMGFKVKLPAVLNVAGFPGGLVVGFSSNPKGKRVEHLNSDINYGITLKGGLNIMGMMLQCRLSINYPHELTINASVSPLKMGGGLISLRKNSDDLETGPKLYIRITNSSAEVRMEGYAELLGISDNIAVSVADGMEFKMQGLMFNLLPVNVTVFDPFSQEILLKSEFQVSSCLPTIYQDIAIQVTNILNDASDLTTKNMQVMQHEINSAASWHHLAWNKLKKWTSVLKEKTSKLQKKSDILNTLKDSLKINCVEQCPLTCVGGPTTNVKCKKVLNTWFPCFEWDECKKKIEDPACISTCVGKKVYNEAKVAKKKASMIGVGNTITSVKKLAKHIKLFLMKSLDLVYVTEKAAVTIEKIAVYGGRAVNLMANYTKDDVIDVRHICFNTSLDKATSACFDMDISVELASKEVYDLNENACVDVNFVQNMGRWIADEIFPGILSLKKKFKEGKRYLKQVKKLKETLEKKRTENEKIEKEVEREANDLEEYEDVQDEEEPLRGSTRESVVPQHSEDFIRHQLYGFYPSVQIQDDSISDAFEKKSPWAYARTDSPFILKKPTGYEDEEASKKDDTPLEILQLSEVENSPRCFQIGSVISTFNVISDTIELITKKFVDERKAYVDELKNYSEKAAQVEDEIIKDCIKVNMSNDRMEDALYYVKRLKTGIVEWSKTVERQLEAQDREALQMWRKSFMELMNRKRDLDIPKLLEILNSVSMSAVKRQMIPLKEEKADNEFAESFSEATKQVNDLLIGDLGSLTDRKDSLFKFAHLTRYLQHNIGNICPT